MARIGSLAEHEQPSKRLDRNWARWLGVGCLGILACTAICVGIVLFSGVLSCSPVSNLPANRTSSPTWSPDGNYIAFAAEFDGNYDIYVIKANGENMNQLTRDPCASLAVLRLPYDMEPAWSPDGSRIAFSSARHSLHFPYQPITFHIFVMNADGSHMVQLTNETSIAGNGFESYPVWSPDGSRIAFTYGRRQVAVTGFSSDIFVMNADGSNLTQLTNTSSLKGKATWSPDGKQIAFAAINAEQYDIFIMDSNGSNVKQLTDSPYNEYDPVWSPDGRQIAFVSDRDSENLQLFLLNLSNSNIVKLTNISNRYAESPAWSPDGKYLAFNLLSNNDYTANIFLIKTDGTGQLQLTGK